MTGYLDGCFSRSPAISLSAAFNVGQIPLLILMLAGLSAIQTAKNMGAIVRGFDTRAAVKEQVLSHEQTFAKTAVPNFFSRACIRLNPWVANF